jgi:hypothetical protein
MRAQILTCPKVRKEAIISMKMDRQTPYDIYTAVLDSVMAAYQDLRDQASVRRFGDII